MTNAEEPSGSAEPSLDESGPHFVAALGLEQWIDGATTNGRAAIGPELCAPGSQHPRIGVLATMADLVVGSRPEGPINPTVDLRVRLLARPAMSTVRVRCDALRSGRNLFVGHARFYADDDVAPFATSVATFMNRPIVLAGLPRPAPRGAGAPVHVEDLMAARFDATGSAEIHLVPRLVNGTGGTVQGGVLATLAELVAERAIAEPGRAAVVDLDVRYLARVRVGPVRATATRLEGPGARSAVGGGQAVEVRMVDVGFDARPVAFVTAAVTRL
ncbi:MAG TPA: hotdog domain-containing protein [Acidimicrobiales bacterium]